MDYDPSTEIRNAQREQARARESERTIAAAYRRAVRLDLIPLALALLETDVAEWTHYSNQRVTITLEAPPESYDTIVDAHLELDDLFGPLLPAGTYLESVEVRVRLDDVDPDWRKQAAVGLAENKPVNQGTLVVVAGERYHGLRFRSYSEIAVAKEFDERDVLYFPLPAGVRSGVRREPDFLIVYKGKVAVLEVHGAPYHPASRASDDHMRNLFFEQSGIFVKVFDAKDCRENPKLVVDTFLGLLDGPKR
jgi:hypothetical protein